jgi:hypothetical protein
LICGFLKKNVEKGEDSHARELEIETSDHQQILTCVVVVVVVGLGFVGSIEFAPIQNNPSLRLPFFLASLTARKTL